MRRFSTTSAQHDDADVMFVREMIPHQTQGVDMAALAPDRAESDQLKQLAAGVRQAQDAEIMQLHGFLAVWGVPDAGPGDLGGINVGFDRELLQLMITHHHGPVEMAETELRGGADPEATALARQIIDAQQVEIHPMHAMLATQFDGGAAAASGGRRHGPDRYPG